MFTFRLTSDYVEDYRGRKVPWGFSDVAGNSFSELTFLDKYSRLKEDGSKESWVDVCERVTNGTYSIQKDYAKDNRLPWNDRKAQASAQEFFDRLFHFKFTPPGRGLWVMGTPIVNVHRNSAALQNCAFVSTKGMSKKNPAAPFAFLMEASMLGVGVGFDTVGAKKDFIVQEPSEKNELFIIEDSREGWVESTRLLINSYLVEGSPSYTFDYSKVRPAGQPIATFGGTAAGPGPLRELHERLRKIFQGRAGDLITTLDIVDIANLVGVCVVSGNVRRSAELALGEDGDQDFFRAKDSSYFPDRNHQCPMNDTWTEELPHDCPGKGWGYMSNNSMSVKVGSDYSQYVGNIALNGEPGMIWLDIARKYGRLIDPPDDKDWRVDGFNPCAEQQLEGGQNGQGECCTLVETYLPRHESLEDFKRTLKFAYLYAKTVTLLPTHWEETNAIMQRNRRIGTSVSGVAEFADLHGMSKLKTWLNEGYTTVRRYDSVYSEWLCVRESIRVTTVKPSGTVSLLAGVTPGVHWMPGGEYFLRSQRFDRNSPLIPVLRAANYRIEDDVNDNKRVVVYSPIHHPGARPQTEVSMWEKAMMAVTAQRYWSDNAVSVTVTFDQEREAHQIGALLHAIEGQLKTISFLKMDNGTYQQMPYTEITKDEYEQYKYELMPVDFSVMYLPENAREAVGEKFCTTDRCEVLVEAPVTEAVGVGNE